MKTKEIILKESPNTDEETLEHCLTAIQAMLDMDDFERAYNYLNGFVSEIIAQTREETIREVEGALPEEAPPIIDILGTEEEYKHNEVIRARISGFNSCLGVVKEELNKLKK